MAHSYDLLLQAKTPGEPAPVAALVTALLARGATVDEHGKGKWKLPDGEVVIEPLSEEGKVKGLDVRVPMLDKTDLIEELVKQLVEVATAAEARVTDPQRGSDASIGSMASISEEYLRMARYAGEYGGVSEALGLSTWAAPPEESSAGRWVLIAAVFAVAAWLAFKTLTNLRESAGPDETPAAMDGSTKIPGQ